MYKWEGLHPEDADVEVGSRDPRRFPIGYRPAKAPPPCEPRFLWFRSILEMSRFLTEYGPEVYQDSGDRLDARNALKLLLTTPPPELTESLRERLNVAVGPDLRLLWWGSFDTLRAGIGQFAAELLQRFRRQRTNLVPIAIDEIDGFVDFLDDFP